MNIFPKKLFDSRELLWTWTLRTIKVRYQQSILGGLWAIIQPTASVIIFTLIFTIFVPVNTGDVPYLLFSFVAMVPWTFFSSSVSDMTESIVNNMNLVTKVYFPREILPVSSLIARLFDFVIAYSIIFLLLIYYHIEVSSSLWIFFPVIVITQMSLSLGLGLLGAAFNVFFRDMRHIFTLGLQIWFYASPIIYPPNLVPDRYKSLYYLNPMAGVIQAYRTVVLQHALPDQHFIYSVVVSFIILIAGYFLFKRMENQFSDVI